MLFLKHRFRHCLVTFSAVAGISLTVVAQNPELPLPPDGGDVPSVGEEQDGQSEILTRGPIHEAFAEQFVNDPQPGMIVEQAPPEPIDELPPEEMPEGENIQWIPGYWAFDEDLDDFIWISGLWRNVPTGQRWVPGYWVEAENGYQWVSGFWTSDEGEELAYLPQPPESLEQGPNVSPPGDDYFWVPGMWVHENYDYRWRPGYYAQSQGDYVWIPARYQWTPRGYVYCSGYWDYPLMRRGTLFSPVHFRQRRYPRRFQPRYTVAFGPLLIHLFARPQYRHYYFGDYYAARYRNRGIVPFTSLNTFGNRRYYYDPLFVYYRTPSRQTTFDRLVGWNRYYDRNVELRPPRTLDATQKFVAARNPAQAGIRESIVSVPLKELSRPGQNRGNSFRSISEETRNRFAREAQDSVRRLTESRVQFEGQRNRNQDNSNRDQRNDRAERMESLRLPDAPVLQSRRRDNLSNQLDDGRNPRRDQNGKPSITPQNRNQRDGRIDSGRARDLQIPNRGRLEVPKPFDGNLRGNDPRGNNPRANDARGNRDSGTDRGRAPRSEMTPGVERGRDQRNGPPQRSLNSNQGSSNRSAKPQRKFELKAPPARTKSQAGANAPRGSGRGGPKNRESGKKKK